GIGRDRRRGSLESVPYNRRDRGRWIASRELRAILAAGLAPRPAAQTTVLMWIRALHGPA
ncbi:MAG: hypothetical protein M3071_08490, partial [Actinomycetota bacterium]|nr:hypothetical protein [Actinomycetota bacterium]